MAFRATDGAFLWQDLAPRVNRGLGEFLLPSTTSAPYVEGNRLYYVTAECQLRCLDTQGSAMARQWPYQEVCQDTLRPTSSGNWTCARLGVFPHEASNSDVLPIGDLLIVCTSNGRNEGHTRVPSPRAPSLIAVDKRSGDVVWRAVGAGRARAARAMVQPRGRRRGRANAGALRRRRRLAARVRRRIRPRDLAIRRQPERRPLASAPGVLSRSPIIASPVYDDGRVFIAMGDDPSHGNGPSLLHAISPNGQGDVTDSRRLWTSREIGRVVGTPIVKDGLLYVGDLGGTVHCLDAATGASSGSTKRTRPSGAAFCSPATGCTSATWTAS